MPTLGTSFSRHILAEVEQSPGLAASLAPLLTQISYAAKILSREFGRAALVGKLETLHQRVPFVVGSSEDVAEFEEFLRQG